MLICTLVCYSGVLRFILTIIIADYLNLLNYPLFYEFTANSAAQPHEYHMPTTP